MTGYAFHPEARIDLEEIWDFIRADNLDAADLVVAEILDAIRTLVFALHTCSAEELLVMTSPKPSVTLRASPYATT